MAAFSSKVVVPPLRARFVPRERLVRHLEDAVAGGVPLSLVCAPAGFGKTSLLAQWLRQSGRAAAWLTLDDSDDDPSVFLADLAAAVQAARPGAGEAAAAMLGSPQAPPVAAVLRQLLGELADATLTVVLDDFQALSSRPALEAARLLVEGAPEGVAVVVASRQDPPLPLARWRARGQLLEVREGELRFTREEAEGFLSGTMRLDLPAEAAGSLVTRTEGWPAGMQLAALAVANRPGGAAELAAAFGGRDRYVVDYLLSEVLRGLPDRLRTFLRDTSVLERLSGPLCDSVTGRAGSQDLLEELEERSLLVEPLDHRREWFRYHGLLAEYQRSTLSPDEARQLHGRAAGWFHEAGLAGDAVRHALASGDDRLAASLVSDAAEDALFAGSLATLGGWLAALHVGQVREDGRLALYQAWTLTLTGRLPEVEDFLALAEDALRGSTSADYGKALVLRGFMRVLARQDYPGALEAAGAALALLPAEEARWRVVALWTLAEAQERTAPIVDAIATLREASVTARSLGGVFAPAIEGSLVLDLDLHGLRREAMRVCGEALARFTDARGRLLPFAGLLASRLGVLHHEGDDLILAREWLERGLEVSRDLGQGAQLSFSLGALAPTLHALGERERAYALLREAHELTLSSGLADPGWLLAWEADLRLRDGDLASAAAWARAEGLSADAVPQYLTAGPLLVLARLLLAQGRAQDARRLLARLERYCAERGFRKHLLGVLVLQGLALDAWGDRAGAVGSLVRALRLAATEGYVRAFLIEDARVLPLLRAARETAVDFVDHLLERSRTGVGRGPTVPPDVLTAREGEVLRLIAAGLSNAEIAAELEVTVATVKRHINGLYGKLGVDSRTRALNEARRLGLLFDPSGGA